MSQKYLSDQRGVAMLLELVLVAVVLSLVGVAIYQANRSTPKSSLSSTPAALSSTENLAASAAATTEQEVTNDSSINASADAAADELTGTDDDVANLGDSFNENNF